MNRTCLIGNGEGGGKSLPFSFLLAYWPGDIFFAFSRRAKASAKWARSTRQASPVVRVSCLPGATRLLSLAWKTQKKNNACSAGYLTLLPLLTPAMQAALKFLIGKLEFYFWGKSILEYKNSLIVLKNFLMSEIRVRLWKSPGAMKSTLAIVYKSKIYPNSPKLKHHYQ